MSPCCIGAAEPSPKSGKLAELRAVIDRNERSWASFRKFEQGDSRELAVAAEENRLALQFASRLENPTALAWCRLQEALILGAQRQFDEGWSTAQAALAEFDRIDFLEGEATAHTVLGRLAASRGSRAAARNEFDVASHQFPGVLPITPALSLRLDEAWQASERSLGKTWAASWSELERQAAAARVAKSKRDWSDATAHHQREADIAREIFGPWHPALITAWNHLGQMAWCRGDFSAAIMAQQEASAIAEKLFEPTDPERVAVQMALAFTEEFAQLPSAERQRISESVQAATVAANLVADDAAAAEWDKAAVQRAAALGDDHLFVGLVLFEGGLLRRKRGKAVAALEDYVRGAATFDQAGVKDHLDYLTALVGIAELRTEHALDQMTADSLQAAKSAHLQVVERPARAVDASIAREYVRALEVIQSADAADRRRIQLAWQTVRFAPPGRSHLDEFAQAVAELESAFEPESEVMTGWRAALATRYRRAGRLEDAQTQLDLAKRAVKRRDVPPERPVIGDVYLEQVVVSLDRGELRSADEALRQALAAWRLSDRADSAAYLTLLRRSTRLHVELAEYSRAEADAWQTVLLCQRRLLPPDHPAYASAQVIRELDAELLKQKSAVTRLLQAILDLGDVRHAAGAPRLATQDYETVLAVAQKIDSESGEFLRLNARRKLGGVRRDLGELPLAEELLKATLEDERRHGLETFYYADTAHQLAVVLQLEGKRNEALQLFDVAVASNPRSGEDVRWAEIWKRRAGCQAAADEASSALKSIETSLRLYDRRLTDLSSFRVGSRLWQARNDLWQPFQQLLTLALELRSRSDVVENAWNWSMRIKGRALGSLMHAREMQRLMQDNPELVQTARRCVQIANEISDLALNPPTGLSPAAAAARMERSQGELDGLLGELNRASSRTGATPLEPSLSRLRERLPPKTALIEYVRAPLCDWSRFGQREFQGTDRYLAFVLPARRDARPFLYDLGEANAIDEAIQEVRKLIKTLPEQLKTASEKFAEEEYQAASQELYRLLLEPMEEHLHGADLIDVVPDGELQRVAFETLSDRRGHYLIEQRTFAYLTSVLDLLRPGVPPGTGAWVLANPDYDSWGEPPAVETSDRSDADRAVPRENGRPNFDVDDVERGGRWEPLKYAAEELKVVSGILSKTAWGPVRAWEGKQASEETLKSLRSPRVLHLATHGFFVKDILPSQTDGTRGSGATVGYGRLLNQKNPFLRSGLILAGANRLGEPMGDHSTRREDGWVTAEEIATLELAGTELVVLSACETGLGDVKTGEGVHGLRQALIYAGTKAVITSLYQVSDASTERLMRDFYQRWTDSSRALESLHTAELQMIRMRRTDHGAAHPYYWGSFVFVGNPH
ncbi:MAG: CHAT domain-containing tetratricopeptide repeat protein [Planctomycetaceae bacterium]